MRDAHPQITAAGVRTIAVGTGSAAQAKQLMAAGSPFACLVDGDARLYQTLGIGRIGWETLFSLRSYLAYLRARLHGIRRGKVTGDWRRLSGVALFDAELRLRWLHRGSTLGDYPAIPVILDVLRSAS